MHKDLAYIALGTLALLEGQALRQMREEESYLDMTPIRPTGVQIKTPVDDPPTPRPTPRSKPERKPHQGQREMMRRLKQQKGRV